MAAVKRVRRPKASRYASAAERSSAPRSATRGATELLFSKLHASGQNLVRTSFFLTPRTHHRGKGAVELARRSLQCSPWQLWGRQGGGGAGEENAALEEERANAEIACKIYDLRKKAGLTQQKLAELVGTSHSVISRLEDSDYEGHSLAMLNRIAAALNQRVEIRFVPLKSGAEAQA